MPLSRDQKKGRHELRRKQNRKRMRLHKHLTSGKTGPEGKDLAHHHGFNHLTKAQKKAALAEEANATVEAPAVEAPKTEAV